MWKHALESIQSDAPTVLVAVVDCVGSVPGTTGAKVVVSELGCVGTIGGGIAEKELVDRAREHDGAAELVEFVHSPSASDSYCLGTQTFAVLPLRKTDMRVLEALVTLLEEGRFGTLTLSASGLTLTADQKRPTSLARRDEGWTYVETVGKLETLYLIGGGHVSLALSRIMATLPFRIVVLDDRPGVPTLRDNHYAHDTRVIRYENVADHVAEGELSYVVIMTYGHHHDEVVLEHLAGRQFKYLGMLGSAAKVEHLFSNVEDRGVPRAVLDDVRSPVGLPIGSHTPEEIAISIAAEIVKVRNGV